ncbi:MAG: aspartyl protease family protein [Acidobacteriota bacterium]
MKADRVAFLPRTIQLFLPIWLVGPLILSAAQPTSLVGEAEALLRQGDLNGAKRLLDTGTGQGQLSGAARALRAQIALLEDDLATMEKQLRLALRGDSKIPSVRTTYGHYLLREGDFDAAEREFLKSLKLNPKQAWALVGLGRLALSQGRPRDALAKFEDAAQLDPSMEDAYFYSSEAYGAIQDVPNQIASLERYLALKPKWHPTRAQNAEGLLQFFKSLDYRAGLARIQDLSRAYEVEFQPFFGLMIVEGFVNGEGPFRFLVDTGATSTVLSEALLKELKIPSLATATVKCVGGDGTIRTQMSRLDRFKLGDLEIKDLPVASFDNTIFAELIDGVVSTADLSRFLITLDYPDHRILLTPRPEDTAKKHSLPERSSERIKFRTLGNLVLVPVALNQTQSRNFLLDTGAVMSTLSKRQASLLGVNDSTPNSRVDLQFAGACGVTQSVLSVENVELGIRQFKQQYAQILAVELKEISREIQTEVSGIVGSDFLSRYRVTIDYDAATLLLESETSR